MSTSENKAASAVEGKKEEQVEAGGPQRTLIDRVTVRLAGDSGDGIQLTGDIFAGSAARRGSSLATLPDYPSEVRSPAGSLPGVSSFQIQFGSEEVSTAGDRPDVLVAFNPAALKVNIEELKPNGIVLADSGTFEQSNLRKAHYERNPLEDGSLSGRRVFAHDITGMTLRTLADFDDLTPKEKRRCKNFFVLGMIEWLFDCPLEGVLQRLRVKFAKRPVLAEANERALKAGYAYCEAKSIFYPVAGVIHPTPQVPGTYRNISGNQAAAFGLIAAAVRSGLRLVYASYPITPASDILHELAKHKNFGVITHQCEDEIAAICSAVGASFAGALAVTGTSGPGSALKTEALGLAVITELPLVLINVQRGGPSTGLPTKTEQADLLHALCGRPGEAPLCVLAPGTPAECFSFAYEACRLAVKYMTPVYVLSDGYLANGAEPWRIPTLEELPELPVSFVKPHDKNFHPYVREPKTLARPWAIPGTPGTEHRVGGLEKRDVTGEVDMDPENHERMVRLRAEKIQKIADEIPPLEVQGPEDAELLVLGWGSTWGTVRTAVAEARAQGLSVAGTHFRYLNPLPKNTREVLSKFPKVLAVELNTGQFRMLLRAETLLDIQGCNKIQGRPFHVSEVLDDIKKILGKA